MVEKENRKNAATKMHLSVNGVKAERLQNKDEKTLRGDANTARWL